MSGHPRILHVAAVDYTAVTLLTPQLRRLREVGYDVRLACRRTDDRHWDALREFDPVDIAFPRALRPAAMLGAARRLARMVSDWEPALVHLHSPAASLAVRALPSPWWPRSTRVFYTVHGFLHTWPPKGALERVVQRAEQWQSRRTHTLLFQSVEDLGEAQRRGYSGHLVLLGNGVEDDWFEIPSRTRDEQLQLVFVGRLVREKGVVELARAISARSDVHLHVVGEALPSDRHPVGDELDRIVRDAGAGGRVTRHGILTRDELAKLMEGMDVLCLPSHREGVPRSVIEALAAGRPAIVTDIRGSNELVQDGVNGWVVPPGDVAALTQAIGRAAELAPEDLGPMGSRARGSVDPARRESRVLERLVASYASAGVPPPGIAGSM